MAAYFLKRIDKVVAAHGNDHWQRVLEIEFGGMNDVSGDCSSGSGRSKMAPLGNHEPLTM